MKIGTRSTNVTSSVESQKEQDSIRVETFASLINRKIVAVSDKVHYYAVERHFFAHYFMPVLNKIFIDENWYLENYPDVAAAITEGIVADAKDHYVKFGYYEHRMPYLLTVDESWYRDAYPDVADAVRDGIFSSGQNHFMEVGFREGRFPHPEFTLRVTGAG